jgi:hypothetical protein
MIRRSAGGRADQERAQKAMVAALRWPSPLQQKLSKCGEQGHWLWNEWRCHSPACVRCRGRYARKQERQLCATLGDAKNADLSMFTIMFGIAAEPDDIGPVWLKAKSDLRNRINAMRRESSRVSIRRRPRRRTDQAAIAVGRGCHFHGSSSSRRLTGWSAMRARMSASHACGSTSLRRQV